MRFYTRKRRTPTINIISLIDILVILLIFFIATATFKKTQPQLEINLPESKTARPIVATTKSEPLVLSVKSADQLMLGGQLVALSNLANAIRDVRKKEPERPIALQGDTQATWGVLVQVFDALRQAGVKNTPAFVQPETKITPSAPASGH